MKQTTLQHKPPSVASVMISCSRRTLIIFIVGALLIAFISLLPTLTEWVEAAWFKWARVLTQNYSTTLYAALVEWVAIPVAIWAACVSGKLSAADSPFDFIFACAAALIVLLAIIPANCALWAMLPSNAAVFEGTFLEIAAHVTPIVMMFTVFIAAVCAVLATANY